MNRPHYFIGVDISSDDFTFSLYDLPKESYTKALVFLNDIGGFEDFGAWLKKENVKPSDLVVCMEATGVYGEGLCYFLASKGISVAVEPPHKIKRTFKELHRKNDALDSRQIAEYANRYFDRLTIWEITQHLIRNLDASGESGAARIMRQLDGERLQAARDLSYHLFSLCERNRWAELAIAYNSLIVAWPEISQVSRSLTMETTQANLF